jgi:predicted Na+-dependent transporter
MMSDPKPNDSNSTFQWVAPVLIVLIILGVVSWAVATLFEVALAKAVAAVVVFLFVAVVLGIFGLGLSPF